MKYIILFPGFLFYGFVWLVAGLVGHKISNEEQRQLKVIVECFVAVFWAFLILFLIIYFFIPCPRQT